MALHINLPIYTVAYDLLSVIADLAKNMPREFRAIGATLREDAAAVVNFIFRANCSRDKAPHLMDLIERVEVINLWLRISRDKRWISIRQYARAIELTGSIGKQATGWRRSAMSPAS